MKSISLVLRSIVIVGAISGLLRSVKADAPAAAPPPPAAPVAEKGDLQLSGLYFQLSSLAIGGRLQFSYYYYYFLPDGHVFYGMPPGGTVKEQPSADDVAALVKADPKSLGVYKVTGDQITIVYPGGKPQIHKAAIPKKEDLGTIVLNGTWAVRQPRFKENQTFDAKYATTSTIRTGGDESHGGGDRINIRSLNTLDFHADGTFTGAGAVDLDVTSKTSNTGDTSRSADHGKYQFSGNTLTLTHADGKTQMLTAFPQPDKDESPPQHININGATYNHEK
jgi:hypothetical protein